MVKRERDQSQETPIFFCCWTMRFPYFSFHFHTRWRNFSRPKSWRLRPSLTRRSSSTFTWVEMPAWSTPGSQRVEYPCIRLKRVRMSWRVQSIAWPMWSCPVTLGGGMTMEKGFLERSGSPLKQPAFSHIS